MTAITHAPAAVLPDFDAYAQAVDQAGRAAAAYYGAGDSPMDDDAYDRLVRGIAAFEAQHPDRVLPVSPTGKVAGGAAGGDVPHTAPMLSLDNVFAPDQLASWAAGVERRTGRPVTAWAVEPKLDGLAVAARYEDGRLVRLVTRGNGTAGEDVSHAVGTVVGLPDRLADPETVEVRGEVLMTHEQFEQANATRTAHGAAPFANPRNGAAGTLRAQDRPYTVEMTFFAYGALPTAGTAAGFAARLREAAHHEVMAAVADLGVQTTAATDVGLRVLASLEEVQARIEEIAARRAGLPFGIDGIVVKADLVADQADAGLGSRAPRWAIAYKLPAVEKVTRLLGVEWAVGRTGVIAPRAVLEPVEIDGSTVTYATLHNPADITRRDLRLGDRVTVHRAGDVIPRVQAPVAHLRTGEETPIVFPEVCPHCGSEIDTSEQRWRCVRGRACRLAASLTYAAGRDQLDIEGLGTTRVHQLVDTGLVADVADLFTLTREQLLGLERMGQVSADNLLAAVDQAKGRPLNRVFCALGVRGTGRSMSRRIARHFATMEAILDADAEALQQVEGIGPERAALILAELAELAPVIGKLVAAGVTMTEPGAAAPTPGAALAAGDDRPGPAAADEPGPLAGMTVVVTGTMTGPFAELTRNQVNELIERAGGRASSSVSKRTSLLVAGEGAGSKRTRAEDLGVPVTTPDGFAATVAALLA